MKNKKNIKLYNMIFPIWLLWVIPITWIVVLPANFIIDFAVVFFTLKYLGVVDRKQITKSVILKVWIFGFISDFIGTFAMMIVNFVDFGYTTPIGRWWYDNLTNAVTYNPLESIYALLWVTACVAITALFIYFFNYKFSFRKTNLSDEVKKKVSISMAVFTAPYLFYLPTSWFLR